METEAANGVADVVKHVVQKGGEKKKKKKHKFNRWLERTHLSATLKQDEQYYSSVLITATAGGPQSFLCFNYKNPALLANCLEK